MENLPKFKTDPDLKLMDRVAEALSYYQYAEQTMRSYTRWISAYIKFLGDRKVPQNRFHREIPRFLDSLVIEKQLSSASRIQAENAIAFLFKRVFDIHISSRVEPAKTRSMETFPKTLTRTEVRQIFRYMNGKHLLMAKLIYGSGLRLVECTRLRICSLDFKKNLIQVSQAHTGKYRQTILPISFRRELVKQIKTVKQLHSKDEEKGVGQVYLPQDWRKRYNTGKNEFQLQYLFPAKKLKPDSGTGILRRYGVHESGLQKAIKRAARRAGLTKKVSCKTLRHSFGIHMLENNVNVYTLKDMMGHADIRKTQIYVRMLQADAVSAKSPLDTL